MGDTPPTLPFPPPASARASSASCADGAGGAALSSARPSLTEKGELPEWEALRCPVLTVPDEDEEEEEE